MPEPARRRRTKHATWPPPAGSPGSPKKHSISGYLLVVGWLLVVGCRQTMQRSLAGASNNVFRPISIWGFWRVLGNDECAKIFKTFCTNSKRPNLFVNMCWAFVSSFASPRRAHDLIEKIAAPIRGENAERNWLNSIVTKQERGTDLPRTRGSQNLFVHSPGLVVLAAAPS